LFGCPASLALLLSSRAISLPPLLINSPLLLPRASRFRPGGFSFSFLSFFSLDVARSSRGGELTPSCRVVYFSSVPREETLLSSTSLGVDRVSTDQTISYAAVALLSLSLFFSYVVSSAWYVVE